MNKQELTESSDRVGQGKGKESMAGREETTYRKVWRRENPHRQVNLKFLKTKQTQLICFCFWFFRGALFCFVRAGSRRTRLCGRQRTASGVSLPRSPPYCLRQGFLLNLTLTISHR